MEGVFKSNVDFRCNGKTYRLPLEKLMVSSSLVDLFRMSVELPHVLKYVHLDVLFKLLGMDNLPDCMTWLKSEEAKVKMNAMLATRNILRYNSASIPKALTPCMSCYHQDVNELTKNVFETFFFNKIDEICIQEYVFVAMSKGYVFPIHETKCMDMKILRLEDKYTHEWLHYEACVDVFHAMVWFCGTQKKRGDFYISESSPHWKTKKRNRDYLFTVKEFFTFFVDECKEHYQQHFKVPENKRLRRLWKAFLWRLVLQSTQEGPPHSIQFVPKDL
jgi:hypothetical protein